MFCVLPVWPEDPVQVTRFSSLWLDCSLICKWKKVTRRKSPNQIKSPEDDWVTDNIHSDLNTLKSLLTCLSSDYWHLDMVKASKWRFSARFGHVSFIPLSALVLLTVGLKLQFWSWRRKHLLWWSSIPHCYTNMDQSGRWLQPLKRQCRSDFSLSLTLADFNIPHVLFILTFWVLCPFFSVYNL